MCDKMARSLKNLPPGWMPPPQCRANRYLCFKKQDRSQRDATPRSERDRDKEMKLLFLGLGGQEILIIAIIVLLLFGGKKIPELMSGIGRGVRSFREGLNGAPPTGDARKDDSRGGSAADDAPAAKDDAAKV